MPKMSRPDNRVRSRRVRASQTRHSSHIPSVGELLARSAKAAPTTSQDHDLKDILFKVKALAGAELASHLVSLGRRESSLLVWVDSAGWSVRARYALLPRLPELQSGHPWVAEITVRVLRTPARSGA
jgi:hypothetical protein